MPASYGTKRVPEEARAAWRSGDLMRAGYLLYRSLPNAKRPIWAVGILAAACSKVHPPREVQHVLDVALDIDRWNEGHDAFDAVRSLTLQQEDAGKKRNPVLCALLLLAENTAKVAYNASGCSAPFDEDCGDRLVPNARALLDVDPDPELAEAIEVALFSAI